MDARELVARLREKLSAETVSKGALRGVIAATDCILASAILLQRLVRGFGRRVQG